ncbi:MAG: polysaccharide deacetylase family protein [Selenomonadaceae bacterium]|nr:polysaccharide deacetylase family protein [Selenomonadaceae bacterium]
MKKFLFVLILIIAWGFFSVFPSHDALRISNYALTEAQPISEIAAGPKILVLNYHQVNDSATSLAVPVADFDSQMAYLVDSGYIAITPDALLSALEGELELPPKPMLITFDDGYTDNYENAFPILQKYGLRATIFIIPAFVGKPGYMTWDELKEMEENGITMQSHTLNHIALEELPDDGLRVELLNSKRMLEEKLGHAVDFVAYPTGTYNLHIAAIAKEVGYKGAFTIKYGNVDLGSNLFALERVPIFHTATTMKDFYERIEYRQNFEEFGWIKK